MNLVNPEKRSVGKRSTLGQINVAYPRVLAGKMPVRDRSVRKLRKMKARAKLKGEKLKR